MYNLKSVYVAISFASNCVNIIISENAGGSFNLIWSDSFKNENYYDEHGVLVHHALKLKLKEALARAEDYINVKIEKVLISFEGTVNELDIKVFRTPEIVYTNPYLFRKRAAEFVNELCATRPYFKNTSVLSWKFIDFVNKDGSKQNEFKNLEAGKKYQANVVLYASASELVAQLNGLVYTLGYEIIKTSLCQLNFHSIITDNNQPQLLLDMHANTTHLLTFINGSLLKMSSINFGESDIFDYIAKCSENSVVNKTRVVEMVSQNINQTDENPINLVCQTSDEFLNMGFVNTRQLSGLVEQSLSKLVDAINYELTKISSEFKTNISKIVLVSQMQNIAKRAVKLKKVIPAVKTVVSATNDFMFLDNKYYLAALAIMWQVKHDLVFGDGSSCIEPFYSDVYDKKLDKSLAVLNLNRDISNLVQKLIK